MAWVPNFWMGALLKLEREETLPTAEDEAPGQEERDIMCGACGQILKRNAYKFCVRCGVKLNPESVWDAQLCNSTHDTPNIARVRQEMIGRGVKVVIADGRIFVGRFLAFDKQRSMILSECREYRRVKIDDDGPEKEEKRNAGLILIGGKFIKSVHWAKLTEEGKQKLKEEEEERRRKEADEEREAAAEEAKAAAAGELPV